jgi:hypothetical protein
MNHHQQPPTSHTTTTRSVAIALTVATAAITLTPTPASATRPSTVAVAHGDQLLCLLGPTPCVNLSI